MRPRRGLAIRSGETTRTSSEPGEAPAPPRLRLVSLADGVKAGGLLAMGLIAWLVPESRWSRACRLLAHALMRVPHGGSGIDELIAGQGFSDGAASIYEASQAAALESLLQLLRDYRPGGWRPTVTVEGGEHLEEALERGHGTVLWAPARDGISLRGEGRAVRGRIRGEPPELSPSRLFGDAPRSPLAQPDSDASRGSIPEESNHAGARQLVRGSARVVVTTSCQRDRVDHRWWRRPATGYGPIPQRGASDRGRRAGAGSCDRRSPAVRATAERGRWRD